MIKMKKTVTPGKTPTEITVSMIDQDLKDGISKPEMVIKYGIKPYEVDEMFKHPFLKGRRPSRKKALSFSFVDDVTDAVDPNQVTLEDAITEATKEIETAVNGLADVNNAIVDMLGPTDETPEEILLKAALDTDDDDFTPPSFEDTLELVEEQEMEAENIEEELEVENDTFDL